MSAPANAPKGPPPFTARIAIALAGILIGAMVSGINNRMVSLALADIGGQLGAGQDALSWLTTWYGAGELLVMPFAGWFAITFGMRRFHQFAIGLCCAIAFILPFVQALWLMTALRFVQGMAAGCLVPVLMMAALRFMPPPIRLYGLSLYALTATFAPYIVVPLTGFWSDGVEELRGLFWQVLPAGFLAAGMVQYGLSPDPVIWPRFRQGNWWGALAGGPGLVLLVIALTQGNRLDWFESPLICWTALASTLLIGVYLLSEWRHPTPFLRLQLLGRRNLGLGFSLFLLVLVCMMSASMLPSLALSSLHAFRNTQLAPLALVIALPQLVLAPLVAGLLYCRWMDARIMMAAGFCCIGTACWLGSHLTSVWMAEQFFWAQALQSLGQPMVVVSLLFLATSVVQPMEGPYVAGTVNTLRAFGTTLGAALIERLIHVRAAFHSEALTDSLGHAPSGADAAQMLLALPAQAGVLAGADALRVLGGLAFLAAPLCLLMNHIPAPARAKPAHAKPEPAGTPFHNMTSRTRPQ